MKDGLNYRRINLKRKVFTKGGKQNFKRFKREPKYVKENLENKIAKEKEKDAYHFTDSEEEQDDLGMGLDLSDLPFLDDNDSSKQDKLIALTQDSVCPLFANEQAYDEAKLEEGLLELKYSYFRPNQKETIKRILFGRSTLFISPTGSGKSLCYQLPALLYWRYRKYMTIVVSPLISLMEDQMNNFPKCLKAVSLHSNHSMLQRRRSIQQLVDGTAQVAFISPEAIIGGLLNLDDLKNLPPVGFVCIDEAHCLSEWSHNFRPAYMQFFKVLHDHMKIKTYLGLTATATRATSFAISRQLTINPDTDVVGVTTVPDNLLLSVSYEVNKEKALIDLLKSPTFRIMTSIIVYCNRREETERAASRIRTAMQNYRTLIENPQQSVSTDELTKLNDSNSSSASNDSHRELTWTAEAYHAGLSSDVRKRIQKGFIKGEIRVVVATIAFGMGINKANVRAIIHYDMPSSFENYVQEIGRAGRDGKPAQCHMFLRADKTDLYYQQRNIYSSITEKKNLKKLTSFLFKPCNCSNPILKGCRVEKLDKLNEMDPHIIRSGKKTNFIQNEVNDSDDENGLFDEEKGQSGKENISVKYTRKSVVRKHRFCEGHQKTFSVDEATNSLNLKIESIITLICQLQKAYPQLKITQFPPIKSTVNLLCYGGTSQMETLSQTNKLVKTALFNYKMKQIKEHGSMKEIPNRLKFDIVEVAAAVGIKSVSDAIRLLKKTEWELVEKTGRFRRSQVRVNFEGNSFHVESVGDLNQEEIEEVDNFLADFTDSYEKIERAKMARVFNTFRKYSIGVEQMSDKKLRLTTSSSLKTALNTYFDRSQIEDDQGVDKQSILDDLNDKEGKISSNQEEYIRKNARAFKNAHKERFTPKAIARIFQGISTPNYPAEIWGMNRKWWRIHIDVDFLQLTTIIKDELLRIG